MSSLISTHPMPPPPLPPRPRILYAEHQDLPPMVQELEARYSEGDQSSFPRSQQPMAYYPPETSHENIQPLTSPAQSQYSYQSDRSIFAEYCNPAPSPIESLRELEDAPPPYSEFPEDLAAEMTQWMDPSENSLQNQPIMTGAAAAPTITERRPPPQVAPSTALVSRSFKPCSQHADFPPETSKTVHGHAYRPFARAYSPNLAQFGISPEDFLAFIDGLNEAWLANPYIQATNQVGMVLGFVPSIEFQAASLGIMFAAEYGVRKVSKLRTSAYLKSANRELFQPRGLRAQVLQTPEMMKRVGAPAKKLKLPPLETLPEQMDPDRSAQGNDGVGHKKGEIHREDPRIRRIEALKDYVMPLNFNVQAYASSAKGNNWMKKAAEKQENWFAERQNRILMKRRQKAQGLLNEARQHDRLANENIASLEQEIVRLRIEAEQNISATDRHGKRMAKKEMKHEISQLKKQKKELARERDRTVRELTKEGERKMKKATRREEKVAQKVMWVVISKDDGNVYQDDAVGLDW